MPKGKKLSEFEKGQISALYDQNFTLRHIADQLGRSEKVVRNYLNDPDAYRTKKVVDVPLLLVRVKNVV